MKILFYIEPVVFRDKPNFLLPHVRWVSQLIANNRGNDLSHGFASSANLCSEIKKLLLDFSNVAFFEIDQWAILEPFDFKRAAYSQALYSRAPAFDGAPVMSEKSPLVKNLLAIKKAFCPDIIVCSSQNSAIESVFRESTCLFYEQAPFPRIRKKINMFLDPSGHQVNSMLNTRLAEILSLPLALETQRETLATWEERTGVPEASRESMLAVSSYVQNVKRGRKVAVLALQPPDWFSYEGAFEDIPPDELLARWAESLPEGWVGIPTFHRDSRFPAGQEKSITEAFSNIEFLPEPLSQNTTELMFHLVDGLITISSTVAMAACLEGIPAIVTGACPFSALLGGRVEDIAIVESKSESERASLIAFLTHRYCHEGVRFFEEKNYFRSLAESLHSAESAESHILDFREWSPPSIRRFF